MPPTLRVLDVVFSGVVVWLAGRLIFRRRPTSLPPGPRGWPIIGNILDWPTSKENVAFAEMGKRYGDIVHLNLIGTHVILLNSCEAALSMLDVKGSIYSDRPQPIFACDLAGWKNTLVFTKFGSRLNKMRSLFAQALGTRAVLAKFESVQEAEACRLLRHAVNNNQKLGHALRVFGASIIMETSHGYQVKDEGDEWVETAERVAAEGSEASDPSAHLVDYIPALRYAPSWFPGTTWQRRAIELRASLESFVNSSHEWVKEQLATGVARPSLTGSCLESENLSPEQEELIKWTAGTMYLAGSETTVAAVHTFFLCMTLFPEVQAKAQAEIDRVIGNERLPRISDRNQLSYVHAVVLEVLRWAATVPSGIPHAVSEDNMHNGYFIPKDSIVIPNIWWFSRDPRVYSDPGAFRPERFLGATPEQDPRDYSFGFGRRVCPGQQLGEASMFAVCAMALATVNISKALGPDGQEVQPTGEYIERSIRQPKDFPCLIKARSSQADALLREVYEATRP